MKTAGILAEYNPFHNGHEFHIRETRRRTGAEYVIAAISGDFVQRGAPAILSKYDRAAMALLSGADLVFELPLTTAVSSAEGFAAGGVSFLSGLGVVDILSFGCESADADPSLFSDVVSILAEEPEAFRNRLSLHLKQGLSFPKARELAVSESLAGDSLSGSVQREDAPGHSAGDSSSGIHRLLSEPNNILALEYAKAIRKTGSPMEICMIPRQGDLLSAAAVRRILLSPAGNGPDPGLNDILQNHVPAPAAQTLRHACRNRQLLREDDFSDLLWYALLSNKIKLDAFGTANHDLARRVANNLEQFDSWTGFAARLKTKNQTRTAVSRFLTHVLLQLQREDFSLAEKCACAPYARLLGFRRSAAPLLKSIRAHSELPVLSQTARDAASLDADRMHLLDLNISSSEMYKRILYTKSGSLLKSEYRQSTICVP